MQVHLLELLVGAIRVTSILVSWRNCGQIRSLWSILHVWPVLKLWYIQLLKNGYSKKLAGIPTGLAIGYQTVPTSGASYIALKHHLILDRIPCNKLSYLETWERYICFQSILVSFHVVLVHFSTTVIHFCHTFLSSGRGWWFQRVQWLPARFTEHYKPDHERPRKHRHGSSHRRHLLCKWLLVSVGSVHLPDWTNCIDCTIHDWQVSLVYHFRTSSVFLLNIWHAALLHGLKTKELPLFSKMYYCFIITKRESIQW